MQRKNRNNIQPRNLRKKNNRFNTGVATIGPVKSLSFIGKPITRSLDVLIPIYAANTLGNSFYSFSTSLSSPVMSVNINSLALNQFVEYSQFARAYGLICIKGMDVSIYRSSNLISNTSVITNIPSLFLQIAPTQYSAASTSQQQSLATSDNAAEINLNTFDSFAFKLALPPVIASRSSSLNDVYNYGSNVWTPTVVNGAQALPDIFMNLGSLQFPTFVSSTTAYLQIASVHVKLNVVFAAPQSL
jgi:hypothetical protein